MLDRGFSVTSPLIAARRGATAVTTALAMVAALGISAAPIVLAQGSNNAPAADFYQPPANLPDPGELVRSELFPLAGALPPIPGAESVTAGAGPISTDAHRIMYTSIGSKGQPVAVTGTYLQPRSPWPGPGPRPLAVVAPGTQGQGDHCAPSKSFQTLATVQTDPPGVGLGYEILQTYALLARGFAVAVTDYEGIGTPGVHQYVHRESTARAILDIARVADAVPGADTTAASPIVITGYSQGGAAAAAAAEYQPLYAPDIDLVGTSAGSSPADLLSTIDHVDGTIATGVIGYAINGLSDTYPEFADRIRAHLNTQGQAMVNAVANQCIAETVLQFPLVRSSAFTVSGEPLGRILREDPVLMKYVDRQRVGRLRPESPVRILTVMNDDVIQPGQSFQLGRDWCADGVSVQMDLDHTPPLATGFMINHAVPMLALIPETVQYLTDRIEGKPAPSNCGTF